MEQAKALRRQMNKDDFQKIDHTEVYWLGNGGAMINASGTIILMISSLKHRDMISMINLR